MNSNDDPPGGRTEAAVMGGRAADKGFYVEPGAPARALASPLRQEIVDALVPCGASTVAELAERLGRPADRLYFHLKRLEKVGLVRRVGERREGRHLAAVYDVVGRPLKMRYATGKNGAARGLLGVVDGAVRLARRDFRRAVLSGSARVEGRERDTWGGRSKGWLDEQGLARVNRAIEEIVRVLQGSPPRRGSRAVSFTWVLVPDGPATRHGPKGATQGAANNGSR